MSVPIACVIPARGGSVRLPGKNRRLVGGVPLWERAVKGAMESGVFSRIIVTTDDARILEGLSAYPQVLVHERPQHLADSATTSMQVLEHMLRESRHLFGDAQAFAIMTPCHPFRSVHDIREAVSLFQRGDAGAVVSVSEFPCPPEFAVQVRDGVLQRSWDGPVRRDGLKTSYYPNGSIAVVDIEGFLEYGSYYVPPTRPLFVEWPGNLDIDEAKDLALAERLAAAGAVPC